MLSRDKLLDYLQNRILDLHPSPPESSDFVEKVTLQNLHRNIVNGSFEEPDKWDNMLDDVKRSISQARIHTKFDNPDLAESELAKTERMLEDRYKT